MSTHPATTTNDTNRGIKRKRKDDDIATKLQTKFHHELKEVKKAGKKAKTFETRKLIKRLKDSRKTDDSQKIEQLENELEVLKSTNHEQIAALALKSKVKKDKILSKSTECQDVLTEEIPHVPQPPLNEKNSKLNAVIGARLSSSKILAQAVSEVVLSLRALLGHGDKSKSRADGDDEDSTYDSEDENVSETDKGTHHEDKVHKQHAEAKSGREDESGDEVDSDNQEEFNGFSYEVSDEERHSVFGGSDLPVDDDGWESGSIHDENASQHDPHDESPSDNTASSSRSPPRKASRKGHTTPPSRQSAPTGKSKAESTFLPSLSVGFVRGGSDSDWSDGDEAAGDIPKRKNRRGQRARKAIWEKKYGRNANHIRAQREQSQSEYTNLDSHGRNASRGRGPSRRYSDRNQATSTTGDPSRNNDRYAKGVLGSHPSLGGPKGRATYSNTGRNVSTRYQAQSGTNYSQRHGQTSQTNHHHSSFNSNLGHNKNSNHDIRTTDTKPLHPSWEAKKRQKEKQNPAIVPAQGTRMKFE